MMAHTAGTMKSRSAAGRTAPERGGARLDASYRNVRSDLKHSARDKTNFDYELMLMFVRNELAAQWTILLLALIFSLASMFWAPYEQAIGWLIIVIGAKLLLLLVERLTDQARLETRGQQIPTDMRNKTSHKRVRWNGHQQHCQITCDCNKGPPST